MDSQKRFIMFDKTSSENGLPVFRRRFGCLSYQNTVNRGWDKQPANYQPIKSFLKYLRFEGKQAIYRQTCDERMAEI